MSESELNATQASLLGFLHDGPATGWDLIEEVRRGLARFWNVTSSHVYRELRSLESRGFVRARKPGARDKQPFAITASGRRAFAEWIRQEPAPGTDPGPATRHALVRQASRRRDAREIPRQSSGRARTTSVRVPRHRRRDVELVDRLTRTCVRSSSSGSRTSRRSSTGSTICRLPPRILTGPDLPRSRDSGACTVVQVLTGKLRSRRTVFCVIALATSVTGRSLRHLVEQRRATRAPRPRRSPSRRSPTRPCAIRGSRSSRARPPGYR